MSKTIKIIDLLNKIANGEEVPKKIKIPRTSPLTYNEKYKAYFNENNYPIPMLLADNLSNLNDTIKIIEEEPEIDIQSIEGIDVEVISQCDNWLQDKNEEITAEINPYIIDCIRKNTLNFHNKINQLIKAVKKLDNQINNK